MLGFDLDHKAREHAVLLSYTPIVTGALGVSRGERVKRSLCPEPHTSGAVMLPTPEPLQLLEETLSPGPLMVGCCYLPTPGCGSLALPVGCRAASA